MPRTETPLRGIQRIIHPIRAHQEAQGRRRPINNPPIPTPLPERIPAPQPIVTRAEVRASVQSDPLLSQEAKDRLMTYDNDQERRGEAYFQRLAEVRSREPESQGLLAAWNEYRANQRREGHERPRGEIPHFAPLVAPTLDFDPKISYTPAARQERDEAIIQQLHRNLVRDVHSLEPEKWLELISRNQWGNKPTSKIRPFSRTDIKIQANGTVIDSSLVGVELTQEHQIGNKKPFKVGLIMGMGYFHDTWAFPPNAKVNLSPADFKRGVKGYFVAERVPSGKVERLTAVPFAYVESQQMFHNVLYAKAENMKPDDKLLVRQHYLAA